MGYTKAGPFVDNSAPAISAGVMNGIESGVYSSYARPASAIVYSSTFPSVMRPEATDTSIASWVCDGTDDQADINAAIAAVRATSSTGRVLLVGDFFSINSAVLIKTGVHLMGEGFTELQAASDFNDGIVKLYDSTAHASKVSDVWLNGNSKAVHGVNYNLAGGQVFTGRPDVNPDSAHWLRDLLITKCGTSTFPGYGLLLGGSNLRAGHYESMRILGCTGCGVWNSGAPDSHYYGIEIGSSGSGGPTANRSSAGPVGCGFYMQGTNNMITACKAWYSRDSGFINRNPRNSYTNCQAQDNYGAGFHMMQGKVALTGCTADSNGQSAGANVLDTDGTTLIANRRSGFWLPDAWMAVSGCQSYDRGGQSWVQQYGFEFSSAFQYSYLSACQTYANGTASQTGTIGTGSTVQIAADSAGK